MDLIEIVLENCECYTFKREDVSILLDGIGRHIFGTTDLQTVEHCLIRIDNKAKCANELEDWQSDWQTRIHKDITQVHINGECYYVEWSDESDYENDYETDIDTSFDKMYIISKTRKSEDDF